MKRTLMLTGLIALAGAAMTLTGCTTGACPMGSKEKMMKPACCKCGATTKADCKCPGGACAAALAK